MLSTAINKTRFTCLKDHSDKRIIETSFYEDNSYCLCKIGGSNDSLSLLKMIAGESIFLPNFFHLFVCLFWLLVAACVCVCRKRLKCKHLAKNLFCCGHQPTHQMGVYEGRDSFHKFFSGRGLIWAFKVKGKMPRPLHMNLMSLCLIKLRNFLLNE